MRKCKPHVPKPVLVWQSQAGGNGKDVPYYSATVNTKGMTKPEKKKLFRALDELAKAAFQKLANDKTNN